MKQIKSVLVANRGEIAIRVFRACNELGIRTVAIYSKEDTYSLHRNRADEAYLVGAGKGPVEAYLDIEDIMRIAHEHHVDAIHPGYGFLSENSDLAKRCQEEGIVFIGPRLEHLQMFGDKINARKQALAAGIPMVPGSEGTVESMEQVLDFGEKYGYPIIIKAVNGGGGRGMRLVHSAAEVPAAFEMARSEALKSFGCADVYVEKYLVNPKHIEVQILGDEYGNVVHLYERDCSVQRRHQKLVEIAPAPTLTPEFRAKICAAAVHLMKNVGYVSAGTVEFLAVGNEDFYFIEVNPRIQVEHTVTEMITGIDIVQAQIRIAEGYNLFSEETAISSQEQIECHGHAIQCRITTEDPGNNFMPDTGKLIAYRSGGGFGIRLDGGNAYTGSVITPYYDSLLVKATTFSMTHKSAIAKMLRCLKEFRIRGVKTNIQFLENVLQHPDFVSGKCDTCFVDNHKELFCYPQQSDRGTKLLHYIADICVNGYAKEKPQTRPELPEAKVPKYKIASIPSGTRQILEERGAEGLSRWVLEQKQVLFADTTMRDAHQSLFATRMRTADMLRIMEQTSARLPGLFAFECWGGATFDVAYRFLHESPWERLRLLRERCPNILLQMLLRGANAVGYTSYPDNVIREFIELSAQNGVDVFRIFDSLNNLSSMQHSIDVVRQTGKVAESALCYTGDILDPARSKYDLQYYVNFAKELEKAGANIVAIKDMAGLLKPEAAYRLISALKDALTVPVRLHTHEGSGNAIYTCGRAVDAGVDIVDLAFPAMSGGTSQPANASLWQALSGHPRQPDLDVGAMNEISHYWETVRSYYKAADKTELFPNPEVYDHEMPGGQYTNLKQQTLALGLMHRWEDIKKMYHVVNMMFGDIIKVTPSSKVVGDMALFMIQNNLTEQDIYQRGEILDFPASVVGFFSGNIGIPYKGFPEKLQKIVLKGKAAVTEKPVLPPADFDRVREHIVAKGSEGSREDVSASCLYPEVFDEYLQHRNEFGDVSVLDTPTFFFGLNPGEEIRVTIEQGKDLIIKLLHIGEADEKGMRLVSFEFNGLPREIEIRDRNLEVQGSGRKKVNKDNPKEIGATISGSVAKILVNVNQKVEKGQPLIITEAMKMETTLTAPVSGTVGKIHVDQGSRVESGDCLLEIV